METKQNQEHKEKKSFLKTLASIWSRGNQVGNILPQQSVQYDSITFTSQNDVKITQPFGTPAPSKILDRASGWSQLANVSEKFTMQKVQEAFRAAERGDTTYLFAYYRDFILGSNSGASAFSKRKLSTVAEKWNIIPEDKTNPDDVLAAKVITEALNKCFSFDAALTHMLNAVIYPVASLEKIFAPIDENYGVNKYNLRYRIKELYPVDYILHTWRLPYLPNGPLNLIGQSPLSPPPITQTMTGRPADTVWDPDSWEPDLRYWSVLQNGLVNYSYAFMMAPDPNRHIVYRSNLLNGIARENFGGLGKALLFLMIMSQMGLDIYLTCLQKFGLPVMVAKVDMSQTDTVNDIMKAFGDLNVIPAMAINKDAEIELQEMNYSGAADAHTKFLEYIDKQIQLLLLGQVLDSQKSTGGMGTGKESIQSDVRQDYIRFDRLCLAQALKTQLFRQYLDINGIKGSCTITWGSDSTNKKELSEVISNLKNAGFEPTDDSIELIGEQLGFTIQRVAVQSFDEEGNPIQSKPGNDSFDKKKENGIPDSSFKDNESVKPEEKGNAPADKQKDQDYNPVQNNPDSV